MSNPVCVTNKGIPQEMLLGNLLFMNLTDMRIPATDLESIFRNNGIPENYVRKISAADAYRRASSALKGMKIWWDDGGIVKSECRVEVDEVKCDVDSIKRIVGIKHVDESAEEVNYIPVAELSFVRASNQVASVPAIDTASPNMREVNGLIQLFENNFNDWSVYHNKATVRNIVNRIVSDTHPISLMPTGLCKFTPANHGDMLYALKSALADMSRYGTSSNASENIVEIIPVIDTEEQRQLVERTYKAEVINDMNAMVMELRTVLTNKATINSRTATSYIERFKALKDKADDYGNLLNVYEQALQTQLAEAVRLVNDNTETKGSA